MSSCHLHVNKLYTAVCHCFEIYNSQRATQLSASLEAQKVHSQWQSVTNYFSLIWHKPWERTPVMVTKNSVRKVLFYSWKGRQRQIISHSTEWKEKRKMRCYREWAIMTIIVPQDVVIFVEAKLDLMKRTGTGWRGIVLTLKFNSFIFTSWASAEHYIDCNECELSPSDGHETCELNKRQIREIMHTGSCYYRSE